MVVDDGRLDCKIGLHDWTMRHAADGSRRLDSARLDSTGTTRFVDSVRPTGLGAGAPILLASPGDPVGMWLSCGGGSTVGLARNYICFLRSWLSSECRIQNTNTNRENKYDDGHGRIIFGIFPPIQWHVLQSLLFFVFQREA